MYLEINNLLFTYPEQPNVPILDIEHWTVNTGESVFIHGPSGTGKSTLLNLLGGLLLPRTGSISIDGQQLELMSENKRNQFRANHIGFVFQQFNLIPYLTPLENIELSARFGKHQAKGEVRNQAKALLTDLSLNSHTWDKPSDKLSVGQQQRVAIARALINKPSLLIADEPTSSLDDDNKDGFMKLLSSISKSRNLALIFVSHDKSLAKYFDRVEALDQFNNVKTGVEG